MVGLRFADMRLRPTEFLDFTSLTVEEFQILILPFEAAFQAHMAVWCLDGTARTARWFSVYQTCPLATPEDRLFFLLTYLKTYTLQVVQRTPVRDGPEQGQSVDPCPPAGVARGAA
jgi:hypothetical protein